MSGDLAGGFTGTEAYAMVMEATEHSLSAVEADLALRHPDLVVVAECCAEAPAQALTSRAGPNDVIVVGASRFHAAAAFWLGSTARAVVRTAACPVVVVRGDGPHRPERVVVGVDGSSASNHAVRWAGAQADRHAVPLVVVHAWDYPYVRETLVPTVAAADPDHMPGRALAQVQASDVLQVDAALVLEASARLAGDVCVAPVRTELIEGSPATALLSIVGDGDLLVIGSRGRGAVAAGVFGSTANAVIDDARVPVVVVKADHQTSPTAT
jgi:nucleotide-binding universal stress UspA family protein